MQSEKYENMAPLLSQAMRLFIGTILISMVIVLIALLRLKLNISFNQWRIMHQWAAFTIYITLLAHILFVSEILEM
jgi:predicted ferric reductase